MADDFLYAGEDEDGSDVNQEKDNDEEDAYGELFHQAICLKMYRAELEVYRQAREHGIDGRDVPRFISSVHIPPSYHSKHCQAQSAMIKGIPGILMQYLPGFPFIGLYQLACPPPPRLDWQYIIIDDRVWIVQYIAQKIDFCKYNCNAGNTVVR
jgi:hypothetical protein